MITALLDTNVLVSGFVSFNYPQRPPAQILHAWEEGLFVLVISEAILWEVKKTFQAPYFQSKLRKADIEEVATLLQEGCAIVSPPKPVRSITTHHEDDVVFEAAVFAKVDYFVTGDKSLIRKVGSSYEGIQLVTPNDFIEILKKQS